MLHTLREQRGDAASAGYGRTGGMSSSRCKMLLATYEHHAGPRRQSRVRNGGGNEQYYTAKFRNIPLPQAAGTEYFAMDVDDVTLKMCLPRGVAAGPAVCRVRTARLGTAAHCAADCRHRSFAILDDPAPQMVEQLPDVLPLLSGALT